MIRFALFAAILVAPPLANASERKVMLTGFDTIRIDGAFRVVAVTGKPSGAIVTGGDLAIDQVSLSVEDKVLTVSASNSNWGGWPGERHERPVITVTTDKVREAAVRGGGSLALDKAEGMDVRLGVMGSGRIEVENVIADSLTGVVAGSGLLKLGGAAANARFTNSGSGAIDAGGLTVRDLAVTSDGTGSNHFTATRSADITAMGVGDVTIDGPAACTSRGPGPVRCDEKGG